MRKFMEKTFIILIGLYNAYLLRPHMDMAIYFLIGWGISLLLDLLTNRTLKLGLYIFFIGLVFYNPIFIYYLPVIVYNVAYDFGYFSLIFVPLIFIRFSLLNLVNYGVSIYLSTLNKKHSILLEDNKIIRDELKEDALYLKKYSDQLKVDKEKNIHIAILTERNRIARELHDSIGHGISSSILQLEALRLISEGPTKESLDQVQKTLQKGMVNIRTSIHNLYNESLDLENRLEEICRDIKGLNINIEYGIRDEIPLGMKFDILSVVEEAITNCIKHSNASDLSITLLSQPKFYSLVVRDNGSNFNRENFSNNRGIGLHNMKDLASKYKGFVNYEFDNGFRIHLTMMKE